MVISGWMKPTTVVVKGSPGARFVIRLNTPPLSSEAMHNPQVKGGTGGSGELIQSENDSIAGRRAAETLCPLCRR
jgi:hypothetical protein